MQDFSPSVLELTQLPPDDIAGRQLLAIFTLRGPGNAAFGVESHGDPHRDPIWHGMYRQRAQIKDSYTYLNDEPGFGIEIDWAFIGQHKP